jgi:nucleoside-diphosphate-sugar epimerase
MSKILVLGGSGFIGSYIIRKLLKDGYEITCVDNFSKYGFISHDFYTNKNFTLLQKDVRNMAPIEFKGYDYIFCLAALIGGISYFHKIPYRIAKENTEILTHAIDCTLASSPNAIFYYTSSSMVYERSQKPVTEDDARNQIVPITNYGLQKLFGEYIVTGAHQEFGLNYVIVRPFNAVGSGELPEINSNGEVNFGMAHVIPDFIYKAQIKQTPFEIFGDGQQVRTFTHALDIADAISLMIQKNVKNEDFNICGKESLKINDLARKIWGKVNPGTEFPEVKYIPAPEDDVRFRIGLSKKAEEILGWKSKYDINYILEDTTKFIRENFSKLTA